MSSTEHNYKASRAPFLRSSDTTKSIMMDMIVALCFPTAFACYLYGISVLWRVLFAGACCYIADLVANGIRGIHIYTMNKPEIAGKILNNLSSVLMR